MDPDRISVLIAEDEATVREALADLIAGDDTLRLVGAAGDADEAISLAEEHRPDVALLDVKMPGGGGPRAAREIRRCSPDTRVVALSAYEDRVTVLDMLRAGASGYLVKGTSAGEIVEAIRRSIRGQASLSTEVTAEVIHELVNLLDRSERMARELHDLDRMKSELIQVLSHELLTPLTVIQGTTRTLSDLGAALSPEDARSLADSVGRAGDRIRRLVGNLAATARLDREEAEISSRPTSVANLLTMAAMEFPGRPDRLSLPTGVTERVWADPDLATRALVALVENALEHSPDVRPVDVEVVGREDEVDIRVADRGPGVPPEMRERMFGAFTQADASSTRGHEGLGIGLYLSTRIMAAHGGGVTYEPRPGGGSVFVLRFPAVSEAG